MVNLSSSTNNLRERIFEDVLRVGGWFLSQLATYFISPVVGSAIGIAFISAFALMRLNEFIRVGRRTNFLEAVREKVVELELEIRRVREEISVLEQSYKEEGGESRRVLIEEQLRNNMIRLDVLDSIKLYYETLIRTINVIESFRHMYGDKVDRIYDEIIKTASKASKGEVIDKDLEELIKRLSHYIDNIPDFPRILLEVIEEKLKVV